MLGTDAPPAERRFWTRRKGVAAAVTVVVIAAVSSYLVIHSQSRTARPEDRSLHAGAPLAAAAAPSTPAGPSGSADAGLGAAPSSRSSAPVSKGPLPPPPSTGFPDAGNTGVPAGTKLSAYSGPCEITADNTVIDAKSVNCDTLEVKARNVTIKRTKINGLLVTTERQAYSFTLQDSEVDAGLNQRSAVGSTNITILRSNIHGGQTAVTCAANCTIRDSYLHGQQLPPGSDWHLGGFLANDTGANGHTNATLVHNTIVCDNPGTSAGGGCSGDVNLFPDFGPVSFITVDGNLLGANTEISYCIYGGSTTGKAHTDGVSNIVFTNNTLRRGGNRKCGSYGPVTSFDPGRPGNRWENNKWDDGTPVASAD